MADKDDAASRALCGVYKCLDGERVSVLFLGPEVLKKGLPIVGLEYGSELFPEGEKDIPRGTLASDVAEETFARFLKRHTAAEVESLLSFNGVPCSRVLN